MTLKKMLHTIDRSFDAGNRENFILNEILLVVSICLMFAAMLHVMHDTHLIFIPSTTLEMLHYIEIFVGVLFLIEFALRTIYVYIPDKNFFQPFPFISMLVIFSLIFPEILNVAFLRLIYIVKMFKIYHMRRESIQQIADNPHVAAPQKKA